MTLLTPHEIIEPELPTLVDVDTFFERYVNLQLKEHARDLAMRHHTRLMIPILLYQNYASEIKQRIIEQGWTYELASEEYPMGNHDTPTEKAVFVGVAQKSHELPPVTVSDKLQRLNDAWVDLIGYCCEPFLKRLNKILQWFGVMRG